MKFDKILDNNQITLLVSNELLEELIDVCHRKKFTKYFSIEDIYSLISIIQRKSELIKVNSRVEVCRDKKDNYLLSLALDGKASQLITGDNDLLVLHKYKKTVILKIADYIANL